MSYGRWTPNWRTWRNWETGNARNWQTEATSSAGNWHVPAPPVWNWQVPAPPVWNWQTGWTPLPPPLPTPPPPLPTTPPNRYTGPALYWNQQNAMATRDGWRTGETDGIGNWQTELIPERNWHIGPTYNTWNPPTRLNRRGRNWLTGSLPWTNWQTEQDYTAFFPLFLVFPAASDASEAVQEPWRPTEERLPLLLTGLQEIQEFPEQGQIQMPAQEEQPRLTRAERRAALRKLKKKTYSPLPKRDGDNVGEDVHEKEKKEQETVACAICLEDFKLEEEVMLTPCSHMFHENCIVPWVKSHAQCPICRLRFGRLPMNSNQS